MCFVCAAQNLSAVAKEGVPSLGALVSHRDGDGALQKALVQAAELLLAGCSRTLGQSHSSMQSVLLLQNSFILGA